MNTLLKGLLLFAAGAIVCSNTFAHNVVVELENLSSSETALLYLQEGFKHIVPLGLDHILFVLGLFLLSPKLKPILYQATAFTIAHSITLGLAMFNVIAPASSIVEPIISLSIVFIAVENIFSASLKKWRLAIVFAFGLIHGMGFAGALAELGMPQKDYLTSLVMFNIGVELAQISIILAAWLLIGKWFAQKFWYRKLVVLPASILIAIIALYWTVERIIN
jgi:hypothetical protein